MGMVKIMSSMQGLGCKGIPSPCLDAWVVHSFQTSAVRCMSFPSFILRKRSVSSKQPAWKTLMQIVNVMHSESRRRECTVKTNH